MDSKEFKAQTAGSYSIYDLRELRHAVDTVEMARRHLAIVNPRPPGWHNELIQVMKKMLARSLAWYTRPSLEFSASVTQSLQELRSAIDQLSADIVALHRVLSAQEKIRTGDLERPVNTSLGDERTAYIVGLFGTGRWYINELLLQHIGERKKYFRDVIRIHPGPTPMIYSGHITTKYLSRAQLPPKVMSSILGAVTLGYADFIFIYRHPIDSLLTNWIYWRRYIHEARGITGISQIYSNVKDLCAELDDNFNEFETFADGSSAFFSTVGGPRFLSFPEFVEETELHIRAATLALRLEDFMIDPAKEFLKIVEVMSVKVNPDLLLIAPPRTKAFGYLAVAERVPRFRNFIDGLDAETQKRMEKIGYSLT